MATVWTEGSCLIQSVHVELLVYGDQTGIGDPALQWQAYWPIRIVQSVIGRYISYPVADKRASADPCMDLNEVLDLGRAWNQSDLVTFGSELLGNGDTTANSGGLIGNRMFWNSDYMVHRTNTTVTTLKLLSNRTTTSECVNSENPFGFHLSDGLTYTYSTGAEHEDMFATLDFHIPPGITTEYAATPLECSTTAQQGVDAYAGGVQAGDVGVAAMRYINPLNTAFAFHKAWFFFPNDVQHVLTSNIRRSANSTTPVYSVLDQRHRSGDVYVDGQPTPTYGNLSYANSNRLWHAGTGYTLPSEPDLPLSLRLDSRSGSWRQLGLSSQPISTKDMFAAWIEHKNISRPLDYSVFPGTKNQAEFDDKANHFAPKTVVNSEVVSAATDSSDLVLGAAFWTQSGGTVNVPSMGIKVQVDRGVVLVLRFDDASRKEGTVYVSDPVHGSGVVDVRITWKGTKHHQGWGGCIGHHCSSVHARRMYGHKSVLLRVELPEGGMAGSTVEQEFSRDGLPAAV